MLSKNKIKFINSLKEKKFRFLHKKFIIEGNKIVSDVLYADNPLIDEIIITQKWYEENQELLLKSGIQTTITKGQDIRKISSFKTPQDAIALVNIQETEVIPASLKDELVLVLDNIQDPGNLGTIIRLCDWFGIEHLICSEDTADCYNPKVLQATMGSIFRVKVVYTHLANFLQSSAKENITIYGTTIEGSNIYTSKLTSKGIIIMGNESKGIRNELWKDINHKLFIPSFKSKKETVDSLNVAVATAIVCSEFRRTALTKV